jgi:hypothetical protein
MSAIEHSEIHDIGGLRVRLPRVEDLLIMKATIPASYCILPSEALGAPEGHGASIAI